MTDRIALDLPARAEFLNLVRSVVTEVAVAMADLPPRRVDDLRLAVTEACANAIDATAKVGLVGGRIGVVCERVDGGVVVEVSDSGPGFDPDALVPHPPVTRPDRLQFERGLGVPLMRALADEVSFGRSAGVTTVRLVIGPEPDRRPARSRSREA